MPESPQTTSGAAQQFAEFIRTPEASAILRQAMHEALSDVMLEQTRSHSEEAAELLRILATRSGDNREDVLLKAVRLYQLALDAVEKGNSLAIITPEDEIVREITGFEPVGATRPQVGR
jgi:hypothetical protein